MASIALYCISAILTHIFTVINCDIGTSDTEPFSKQICESLLTNCTCYNYEVVYGILCSHMTDFPNFTTHLTSGEIFEENSTYEITFSEIQYLPPKILDGLIVYRLYLDDPDMSAMDKDVFEGVMRLRRFHVRHSKLKDIPDFRSINNSIRSINIDNSRLTSLEGHGLQDLPLVERLSFVNNSIRHIDPDVFKGTDNVVIFDVSYNLLTYLPPNLINPWTKIRKFVLSHNQLLHVNQVFAVAQPRFILLDFNNITDIDSILYPNMTEVETLVLANNPIEKTTKEAFTGTIPNIRFLFLDHCGIRHFNASHFENLEILASLDFSYNLVEEISNQIISIGAKLELDFTGNQIRKFDGEMQFTVKRVWLNNNKLRSLGKTLQFTQIVEVSVARNQLQYLSVEDFRGTHATANLELQGNEIRKIDRASFDNIRNDVHYLDISNNFITSLNGSVKYLSQLKALNISDNLIETFEQDEFTGLNELSEIYLQKNRIKDLTGQLQLVPQIQYLDITQNNIHTLLVEQIPAKLAYLYLDENPLQCDCKMYPFLLWLNSSNSTKTDIQLCPPYTEDEDRKEINITCPKLCTCTCAEDGDDVYISLDCSSRNLSVIPPFLTDDFIQIQGTSTNIFDVRQSLIFDQSTDPNFHIHDRVLCIDLENNRLDSLETSQLPANLIHLYLSNNRLHSLPEPMLYTLKKLKKVSLSGNPWDCNCKTIGFKQWLLSKLDIIQDVNITCCGAHEKNDPELDGKIIWSLTDLDLCPADIGLYVSIAFGVLICILFCLAAKILYTRYKMHIKVFFYSHGVTWVKEKDLDHDKLFDAFISFSDQDRDLVDKELISVIEQKDPNIRLCIHYKHFRAGEYIEHNIYNAVQNSKKTVLVLSKNFLESEWCLLEFRTAHSQALKDKVHRIIVIKVGELPKVIDPTIKTYLEITTYLTWGEKHFWNNLLYVLPTSSTSRKSVVKLSKEQTETTEKDDAKIKHNAQMLNNVGFSEQNILSTWCLQMIIARRDNVQIQQDC